MGSSLLEETGINCKYIFMELAQGRTGPLGRNAVNCCCQPVSTFPAPENKIVVGVQLKNPQVLWEPSRLCVAELPHLLQPDSSSSSTATLWKSSLHTNLACLSSMAWMLSGGLWVLISASLSAEMEGKRVGIVIPDGETSPAGTGVSEFCGAAPLTTGQSHNPHPAPELPNYFRQGHHSPQVNSNVLFIRFCWKTKQMIKKAKHKT